MEPGGSMPCSQGFSNNPYSDILLDLLHYVKFSRAWVFSRSFSMLCAPLSMLGGTKSTGTANNWNTWHRKSSAETQVSEEFAYLSESNNIL